MTWECRNMFCKLKTVVSLLRVIVTLLSLRPFELVKWSPQNASHDPFIGSLVFQAYTGLKHTFKTYYLDVVMLILPKLSICYLSLYLNVSFSADEINYKIRFPTKAWTDELANQGSKSHQKFINEIKEKVSVVDNDVTWVVASLVSQVLSLLNRMPINRLSITSRSVLL